LNRDIRSLLTLFNSIDFTHFFRADILSVEGDWGAIVGIPTEGEVLAASLNLQREFFIDANYVVSSA